MNIIFPCKWTNQNTKYTIIDNHSWTCNKTSLFWWLCLWLGLISYVLHNHLEKVIIFLTLYNVRYSNSTRLYLFLTLFNDTSFFTLFMLLQPFFFIAFFNMEIKKVLNLLVVLIFCIFCQFFFLLWLYWAKKLTLATYLDQTSQTRPKLTQPENW
jgi:hypothetical protein